MKKSTFLGSAVSVLLAFSVISYARTYVQPQDPKPVQQKNQTVNTQSTTPAEAARPEAAATLVEPVNADSKNTAPEVLARTVTVPGEVYSATAYSLRGRTASGKPVARGVIAADPRVLPIGTRVRVEAGAWSGEYVVADTGGAVKGRRIDIWTPTSGEAMRFGRRAVKLIILEVGGKRARTASVRPRLVNSANASPSTEAPASKQ
jgi:3D (Asp-Asp-Asp) domain-containing protein